METEINAYDIMVERISRKSSEYLEATGRFAKCAVVHTDDFNEAIAEFGVEEANEITAPTIMGLRIFPTEYIQPGEIWMCA